MSDYIDGYRRDLAAGWPKVNVINSIRQRIKDTEALADDVPEKADVLFALSEFLNELHRTPDASDIR